MKIVHKHILSLLLVILLASGLFPAQGTAAEKIDVERNVQMTIHYNYGEQAIHNAEFEIYHVADISPYGEITFTEDFAKYPVTYAADSSADNWSKLAQTLYGYAKRDNLAWHDKGTTDKNGKLSFPNTNSTMKTGLYLVAGKTVTTGGYSYKSSPFLVSLPDLDQELNAWDYDADVNPKISRERAEGPHDTVSRKVVKVWEDSGHEAERPEEITVQLLQDGQIYDTVTLKSADNWQYTWSGLDRQSIWNIVETEVENYTVALEQQGSNFIVTNTYHKDSSEEPKPDKPLPDDSSPDDPTDNDIIADNSTTSVTPAKPSLPQTGVLWWPVSLLAIAGMAFLLIGGIIRKREHKS